MLPPANLLGMDFTAQTSCQVSAGCCCFNNVFNITFGVNNKGKNRLFVQGGNITGAAACNFVDTPLAAPIVTSPNSIVQQKLGGATTSWFLNSNNATDIIVTNGLQNSSLGSQCSFKATRVADDDMTTGVSTDVNSFPNFPCGYTACPSLVAPPEIAQWVGSYQTTNVLPCNISSAAGCACLTGQVDISLQTGADGNYAKQIIAGSCLGKCQAGGKFSDDIALPTSSITPPREYNNFNYILTLTESNGTVTVLAENTNVPQCSFSLARPTPVNFTYVGPPSADNPCSGYCGPKGACSVSAGMNGTKVPSCSCSDGYTGPQCLLAPIPADVKPWIGEWKVSIAWDSAKCNVGPVRGDDGGCCCFDGYVNIAADPAGTNSLIVGGIARGPGCTLPGGYNPDDIDYPISNRAGPADFFTDDFNISSDSNVTHIVFDSDGGACSFKLVKPNVQESSKPPSTPIPIDTTTTGPPLDNLPVSSSSSTGMANPTGSTAVHSTGNVSSASPVHNLKFVVVALILLSYLL